MMTGAMLALTLVLASCSKQAPAGDEAAAVKTEQSAGKTPKLALSANDPNVMKISVPTMQCESCVSAITEGVKGVPEAEEVNVDLDTKTVFVKVASNTPETQKKIETAIAETGYSTPSTTRNDAAYKKLPECCQEGGGKHPTEL